MEELNEFKADHSGGDVVKGAEVPEPVTPAGGNPKKKPADLNKKVDPVADKLEEELEEVVDVTEAFASILEGVELSEETLGKFKTIFESAVNESVAIKTTELSEALEAQFEAKLNEAVEATKTSMEENLDKYLDYIVNEWMEENQVAIESGIKVEMAESFMAGLKSLFEEHNVDVTEDTVDVIGALEEELAEAKTDAKSAINESIKLRQEIQTLRADAAFAELSEGMTTTQVERLRILAEKLDVSDLDAFKTDLGVLKESFFKKATPLVEEKDETENPIMTEEVDRKPIHHDSISAIVAALDARAKI